MSDQDENGKTETAGNGRPWPGRKGRFTPEQMAEIFLDLCRANTNPGEIMKKWGLHSGELRRIRERGHAVLQNGFRQRLWSGTPEIADPQKVSELEEEKRRLEEALKEQTIEVQLLKKELRLGPWAPSATKRPAPR